MNTAMADRNETPLYPNEDGRLNPEEVRDFIITMLKSEAEPAYSTALTAQILARPWDDKRQGSTTNQEKARNDALVRTYTQAVPAATTPHGGRSEMASLLISISDRYGKDIEVVEGAMLYLDRILLLGGGSPNLKEIIQKALACLALAIKLLSPCSGCPLRGYHMNELLKSSNSRPELPRCVFDQYGPFSSLEKESGGLASVKTLACMETEICSLLQFKLHPPTSSAFIRNLIELVVVPGGGSSSDSAALDFVKQTALHQVKLLLSAQNMALGYPSEIATAAIKNAVYIFHKSGSSTSHCSKLMQLVVATEGIIATGQNRSHGLNRDEEKQGRIFSLQATLLTILDATEQIPCQTEKYTTIDGPKTSRNQASPATPKTPERRISEGTEANQIVTPDMEPEEVKRSANQIKSDYINLYSAPEDFSNISMSYTKFTSSSRKKSRVD